MEDFSYAQNVDSTPNYADPHEYGWETDAEAEVPVEDSIQDPLAFLQRVMCKKPRSAGPMAPAVLGAPVVATPPTNGVGQEAAEPVVNTEGHRVFKLLEDLREGMLHDELQELYKKGEKAGLSMY